MSKEVSVTFHHDRAVRHPVTKRMLHFIEISETPESPGASDSSIARFLPKDASLSRDASGVTLRLADGDEFVYGWPMIAEARNVPLRGAKA